MKELEILIFRAANIKSYREGIRRQVRGLLVAQGFNWIEA